MVEEKERAQLNEKWRFKKYIYKSLVFIMLACTQKLNTYITNVHLRIIYTYIQLKMYNKQIQEIYTSKI